MSKTTAKGGARQFSGFVVAGLIAAAVNWLSRMAFSALGMSLTPAVICAYVLGMITAYVLMRMFVFEKSDHGAKGEIPRFILVNVVSLVQVWLVTVGLDYWLPRIGFTWQTDAIAHGIGVASPILTSYFGHRYLTFRRTEQVKAEAEPDPNLPVQS